VDIAEDGRLRQCAYPPGCGSPLELQQSRKCCIRQVPVSGACHGHHHLHIIAEAMRGPVTITQRNKPRLVIMSAEDYQALRRNADPRRAYRVEDMPDDLFDEFKLAVEEYEASIKTDAA
jgi:prevent-host-death family protein